MSGHNKWSQIKHKKGATDQKRGALFSKLAIAITAAAKNELNPQFNPHLRSAIDKAKELLMPNDNIERAIQRASNKNEDLDELLFESYGPGNTALLIEAITDSRNRTVSEIKKLLSDHHAKWAENGSVLWAFEQSPDKNWTAKFPLDLSVEDKGKLTKLLDALDGHADVQRVITNAN
jgi:YebC/PmpR family DNA-binding regulatory protein